MVPKAPLGVTVYSPPAVAIVGVEAAVYLNVNGSTTDVILYVPLYALSSTLRTSITVSIVQLCASVATTVTVVPDEVILSMFGIDGSKIEPVENDTPLPD